jgi:uncharacterized phage protein gp47/JayE
MQTLKQIRQQSRDNVVAALQSRPGQGPMGPMIPNNLTRGLSESNAGLAFSSLLYLYYVAKQLMPDTATDWLTRHADIWLKDYGGGQKSATFASGTISATGTAGTIIPAGQQLVSNAFNGQGYQTTKQVTLGLLPVSVQIQALLAGSFGNLDSGMVLTWRPSVSGCDFTAAVVSLDGGTDQETLEELRARVLQRVRNPPMGGASSDYVLWAGAVPGVTRAWCSPGEMGIGTVTVRFMMDDLRASTGGFPNSADVATVQAYMDSHRPVTAIDVFAVAPIPEPVSFTLSNMNTKDSGVMANVTKSVTKKLFDLAAPASSSNGVPLPAQTIYREWISAAVNDSVGIDYFDLTMVDHVMPYPGSIGTMGSILLA